MRAETTLRLIKLVHTAVWSVMAAAIVAIPIAAMMGHSLLAAWLTVLIVAECTVLGLNRGRCPLTDLAARFTPDRNPNFDIYLPRWIAQHNKSIFGSLFVVGEMIWLWRVLAR